MFNPSTGSTLACIQGPKVDISKAGNPQLVFWYYAYPGTDGKITVKVNRNDQEMKEVGTVDYNKLSGSIGWRSVSFDLAGVSNAGVENGYIRPYFYAEGLSTSLFIDNIKIYDAVDNNLSAELDAPAHVQHGKVTVVNVKVTNLGTAKASAHGASAVSNTAYVGDPAAGIGLVTVEGAKADNRVYTVDGQYVGKSLQNLNKGLYIQNGKKVVVK